MKRVNKKELIIKTATEKFAKYGYYATSLENISSDCNITKPAIYYHFKSKKSLYQYIINKNLGTLYERVNLEINLEINPEYSLIKYIEILSDFLSANPDFASILAYEFANHGSNIGDDSFLYLSKTLTMVTKIINKGVKQNIFEIENPMIIQMTIFSTLILHQTTKPIREKVTSHVNLDLEILPDPSLNNFSKIFADKIIKSIKRS